MLNLINGHLDLGVAGTAIKLLVRNWISAMEQVKYKDGWRQKGNRVKRWLSNPENKAILLTVLGYPAQGLLSHLFDLFSHCQLTTPFRMGGVKYRMSLLLAYHYFTEMRVGDFLHCSFLGKARPSVWLNFDCAHNNASAIVGRLYCILLHDFFNNVRIYLPRLSLFNLMHLPAENLVLFIEQFSPWTQIWMQIPFRFVELITHT